ncbi:MAG: hypothetical protein JXB49_37160 [Bacteroidales bacterium]|nr:hypothetical protein [Bacteroidales bacterium]
MNAIDRNYFPVKYTSFAVVSSVQSAINAAWTHTTIEFYNTKKKVVFIHHEVRDENDIIQRFILEDKTAANTDPSIPFVEIADL